MNMLALLAMCSVAVVGCGGGRVRDTNGTVVPFVGEVPTDNKNFAVGKLFTHEGYTVYRFYDGDTAVYYVTPLSGSAEKTASASAHWETKQWVGVAGRGGHYVYEKHQVATVTASNDRSPTTR